MQPLGVDAELGVVGDQPNDVEGCIVKVVLIVEKPVKVDRPVVLEEAKPVVVGVKSFKPDDVIMEGKEDVVVEKSPVVAA